MNISKKWSSVAAGLLTLALVGGGAVSANAAQGDPILNPQSNGSKGSFYLFDGETALVIPESEVATRVFTPSEAVIIGPNPTDPFIGINPAATRDVTGATPFTGVYAFISDRNTAARDGGTNTWKAFKVDSAAGSDGGTAGADVALDSFTSGGPAVQASGGSFWYGIAYTINNGVTVVGSVYREININPGGTYTVGSPIEYDVPDVDVIEEADLSGTETAPVAAPAIDTTVLTVNAGVANANKQFNVAAFSTRTELGTVTLDASGVGTVDVAGKGLALNVAHKLFLYELDGADEVLAGWGSFTLTGTPPVNQDTTDLTVEVTNSGKFELVAPAATLVDLGDVRRDRVSAPVALGAVTVFDDRDVLSGWNLNITSSAFTGPDASTVAASALGYAPVGTTLFSGITAGAAKLAGEGAFGVLAEGAVGSATGEFDGAVIDTNLTFKAPINAAKGVHNAVLTLDLVSK